MNTLLRTDVFDQWLRGLKNLGARVRIVRRIEQAQQGNFGDCKSVGDGVYEMRIHTGPGYRVYYMHRGQVVYLLLCGGDKSTQVKDIKQAKKLAKDIKE